MRKDITAVNMKKIIAIIMALVIIPQSFVLAAQTETQTTETSTEYQAFKLVAGYIADRYIDDSYTAEDIMTLGLSKYLEEYGDEAIVKLIKGAVNSLDDYSEFFTKDEYREYMNSINQTFYGLGVSLQQTGEYVEIVEFVEEGGLAEKSGFAVGDRFVEVDGTNVVGMSISEVRNLIVGELGTTVNVTVLRNGEFVKLVGTRTSVNTSTVSNGVLEGNIGYIKISSFATDTATEFKEASQTLKSKGVSKLILDLRNNGGGVVSSAVAIAQELIPKGKIIDVKYRDSSMNYTYRSTLDKAPFDIVVLVNKNTASASEILASAIRDSKAGILLGEQTYGKAVIQSPYYLNNGMVLKLTVGSYLTRNGNQINKVGLEPDKEVEQGKKKIDTSEYTKFDFLTPVSLGGSGVNVTAAKERLSVLNYYSGNLQNDVFNVDLRDAVADFQRNNALTDSGVIDVPTQIKLKEVFENTDVTVDLQLREAYKYFGGNPEIFDD